MCENRLGTTVGISLEGRDGNKLRAGLGLPLPRIKQAMRERGGGIGLKGGRGGTVTAVNIERAIHYHITDPRLPSTGGISAGCATNRNNYSLNEWTFVPLANALSFVLDCLMLPLPSGGVGDELCSDLFPAYLGVQLLTGLICRPRNAYRDPIRHAHNVKWLNRGFGSSLSRWLAVGVAKYSRWWVAVAVADP